MTRRRHYWLMRASDHPAETLPPTAIGRARPGEDMVPTGVTAPIDIVLYPNRSLSRDGFRTVMAVVIGVNVLNALAYYFLGAWPVIFFCGLDIVLVWLAFRLSYAQGRRQERIVLLGEQLWVSRTLPTGHETRWRLSPYWVRVAIDRPAQHESQLRLIEKGRTLIVGSFLSPAERETLADRLAQDLAAFRAGNLAKPTP